MSQVDSLAAEKASWWNYEAQFWLAELRVIDSVGCVFCLFFGYQLSQHVLTSSLLPLAECNL